ncbi:MAG: Gfo/Idh/MocA family oxidoreductase [Clostridiales bacterium]|nr:Gfo/Idh/MocA family oxidoreductase [Clostridiales bacterium]
MSKIKVGIIGTGGISNEHINGYLKNPDVELYAFCDINEAQLNKMGDKYGIPQERRFTDKAELLKLSEIDAVSVCTCNSAHAESSIAALEAGKHVLCEKPMAMNSEQAKAMKAAADKAGKLLMIGFVRRYGNDCEILKDYIDSGFFGDISRSGGGPLIDLGVHVIDLVRYLLGNPQPVSVYGATFQKLFNRPEIKSTGGYTSTGKTDSDICDVEDLASAMIRFDNGAVLSVEASFSLNIKNDKGDIELFGTKAGAKLDPKIEIYSQLNDYLVNIDFNRDTALSFDGLFAREINHYVDCVINGTPCRAPAQDGVDMMRILDAVYESAKTGHEVILGQ